MRRKKGAPVVIVRKDKRINPVTHGIMFGLTGGLSSVYTAGKAASNAAYNARTRKLMEESEAEEDTESSPGIRTQAGVVTEVIPLGRRHHTLVVYDKDDENHRFNVLNSMLPDEPAKLAGRVVVVTTRITEMSSRIASVDLVGESEP